MGRLAGQVEMAALRFGKTRLSIIGSVVIGGGGGDGSGSGGGCQKDVMGEPNIFCGSLYRANGGDGQTQMALRRSWRRRSGASIWRSRVAVAAVAVAVGKIGGSGGGGCGLPLGGMGRQNGGSIGQSGQIGGDSGIVGTRLAFPGAAGGLTLVQPLAKATF